MANGDCVVYNYSLLSALLRLNYDEVAAPTATIREFKFTSAPAVPSQATAKKVSRTKSHEASCSEVPNTVPKVSPLRKCIALGSTWISEAQSQLNMKP